MPGEIPKTLAGLPTSAPRFVGKPTPRVEDPVLVSGRAEFIDNVAVPGMLHCAILRSPLAHARIARIDTRRAEAMPGVFAVVTGEDALRTTAPLATIPDGWGVHCLAARKVRFVGEPVAAVAAASRYLAEDALEQIDVEYEPLPPVTDAFEAMKPGAPLLLEEKGTNVVFQKKFVWGDVDGAFRAADRVFTERFRWNRLGANPMETFGVIAHWDPVEGALTCRGSYQAQGYMALAVAAVLQMPAHKIRVVSQPHGGSFGGKGGTRGTCIAALLSRKAGGRPVKWIEDRMEYLVGGAGQAWDRHYEASLAAKADGSLLGLRVRLVDDLGGTPEGAGAIGAGIAEVCAEAGAQVVVADLDGARAAATAQAVEKRHGAGAAFGLRMDVTDEASAREAFDTACRRFGGVDVVVPNAGIALVRPVAELGAAEARRVSDVNYLGVLLTIREAARVFALQGTGGHVVVNASKNVFAPGKDFGAYSASKAAAHQLGKVAAIELAPMGVRVNLVNADAIFAEGETRSGLWDEIGPERARSRGLSPDELPEFYRHRNLLHARVTARHVGNAVLFFATGRTPTTGATLPVDGGVVEAFPR